MIFSYRGYEQTNSKDIVLALILVKIKTNDNNSDVNDVRQNKCKLKGIPQVVNIQLLFHTSPQKAYIKKAKSVSL